MPFVARLAARLIERDHDVAEERGFSRKGEDVRRFVFAAELFVQRSHRRIVDERDGDFVYLWSGGRFGRRPLARNRRPGAAAAPLEDRAHEVPDLAARKAWHRGTGHFDVDHDALSLSARS